MKQHPYAGLNRVHRELIDDDTPWGVLDEPPARGLLSDGFWIEHDRKFQAEHRRHRHVELAAAAVILVCFALIFGPGALRRLIEGWLS